jgi:F0F1-type ATP synthase delta subunit
MRYSTHDYAEALVAAVAEAKVTPAAIERNFLAVVRRNGDEMRLKHIVDEAARLMRSRGGVADIGRDVVIESARPLTKPQEAMVKKLLQRGDIASYAIDPNLVAGVKITVNDEMQFDGTMKAKLDTLFS